MAKDYDIQQAFQVIEEQMIESMIRNMKHHIITEKSEGLNYAQWQAEELKSLAEFRARNKQMFNGYFSTINKEIETALKMAYEKGGMDQEIAILEALKKGYNPPMVGSIGTTTGEFFKINDRKINALINATVNDIKKGELAMLRMANDEYRKTIFNAHVYLQTGNGTLEQAVDMATKDFLSRGINCIEYSNGARVPIDSYAKMALRTASTRAYLQGESAKRDEWGINTVLVNRRGVACPKCLQWVGRVYYDDVYGSVPVTDDKYPLLSQAIAGGLYHPNCKDSHTTYFEGINDVPKPMTQAQKAEANRVYALEQRQRGIERNIRKYKRLTACSLDPENVAKYQERADYWQAYNKQFVKANGDVLKRRYENEDIHGITSFTAPPQITPSQPINNKHEHIYIDTVIEPTCTESGYTLKTCSICGKTVKTNNVPAIGHSFGRWKTILKPTYTETGAKERVCSRCGKIETDQIPKITAKAQAKQYVTEIKETTDENIIEKIKNDISVDDKLKEEYNKIVVPEFEEAKTAYDTARNATKDANKAFTTAERGITRIDDELKNAQDELKVAKQKVIDNEMPNFDREYYKKYGRYPVHDATEYDAMRQTWRDNRYRSSMSDAEQFEAIAKMTDSVDNYGAQDVKKFTAEIEQKKDELLKAKKEAYKLKTAKAAAEAEEAAKKQIYKDIEKLMLDAPKKDVAAIAENIVEGTDISKTFVYNREKYRKAITQIVDEQGFNGLPHIVPADEFEQAVEDSGVYGARGIGSNDNEQLQYYENELRNGAFYVECDGGHVHGYGMYMGATQAITPATRRGVMNIAKSYASYNGGRYTKIDELTLHPSAKIIEEPKIIDEFIRRNGREAFNNLNWDEQDVGCLASMMGYDCIKAKNVEGRDLHYFVVLNRTKLIIKDG